MAEKKNLRLNCVSVGTEAVFHVLIGLFSVCCIIPFLFVIIISFSSKESITTIGYSFIPTSWSMDAYQYAFNKLPQIWRSYFKSSVPLELIEAATIDGSGEYSTLFRVVVPIAKPGIATIALLNALAYWNDWFNSLLYIQQKKVLQPLQALLMELQNNTEYLNRMAGMLGPDAIAEAAKMPSQALRMVLVVFIVVPIACAYPFFQRYIVSGLTVGSVKG